MLLPQIADWVPLRNSDRPLPAGAKWLGPVDAADPIMLTIRVRAGTGADVASDSAPPDLLRVTSPRQNQSIARDGADQRDLDRIQQFAGEAGLEVIEVSAPRRSIVLWGTASAITAAFRVQIAHYRYAGAVRRGQRGPICVPRTIAHIVEEVSGVDDGLPDASSSTAARGAPSRAGLHQVAIAMIALLVGGAIGMAVYRGNGSKATTAPNVTALDPVAAPRLSAVVPPVAAPAPRPAATQDHELAALEAAAWRALNAGRLREAQDNFLRVLTVDPMRHESMRGLVAVRRKMAGDDPAVVRRQVAVYQDAIRRGVATDEYYTPSALQLLVSAGLTAAHEAIVQHAAAAATSASISPAAPVPAPSPVLAVKPSPPQKPTAPIAKAPAAPPPAPRAASQPSGAPVKQGDKSSAAPALQQVPVSSAPTPPSHPAQVPPADGPPQGLPAPTQAAPGPAAAGAMPTPSAAGLYTIRVSPILDGDRASAIVKQLSAAGFSLARVSSQTEYRVVSEPLPRQTAQTLSRALAPRGLHATAETLNADTVQLLFGTFASRKDADALAGRIAAAGYDAWIRETTQYTLRVGPYPPASVSPITQIVKAGAPEATVATDAGSSAVSSAAPPAPATSAPMAAPAPAPPGAATSGPAITAPATPAHTAGAAPASPSTLYTIRIGPVSDRDRVAAMAKQLSDAGFSQAQIGTQAGFRVLSEPLPRQVAQTLSTTLAARGFHTTAEPTSTGDTVQLVFGTFTSQRDADALADRIAAAGYDAWIREATVYLLRLGSVPQASVNTVTQIVKAGAPDTPVAADPSSP